MLWGEAVAKGYAAPIWMTFKQALELGGHVRKGEKGSLVVNADRIRHPRPTHREVAVSFGTDSYRCAIRRHDCV